MHTHVRTLSKRISLLYFLSERSTVSYMTEQLNLVYLLSFVQSTCFQHAELEKLSQLMINIKPSIFLIKSEVPHHKFQEMYIRIAPFRIQDLSGVNMFCLVCNPKLSSMTPYSVCNKN